MLTSTLENRPDIVNFAPRARCAGCGERFAVGGNLPVTGVSLIGCPACQRIDTFEAEPPDERWWEHAVGRTR